MDVLSNELKEISRASSGSEKPRFVDCFPEGSGAAMIFQEHVVKLLTLKNLFVCSRTCKQMKTLCRTYALRDILKKNAMEDKVSTSMELELAKFVLGFVNQEYHNKQGKYVSPIDDLAVSDVIGRRYHPATIPDIMFAMTAFFAQRRIPFRNKDIDDYDWEKANSNPMTPVLISATYGCGDQVVDVTMVLRYLLMREGNRRLILERPSNGPRYWYNYLFGDPVFKKRKELTLTARLDDDAVQNRWYEEDSVIDMPLRAESMPASSTENGHIELAAHTS